MSNFAKRLDVHFVAVAAAAGAAVVSTSGTAEAAVVHFASQNIVVPNTTSGVYVNVVTGASNVAPASVPGWDINPWGSSLGSMFSPSGVGGIFSTSTTGGTINLPVGTVIGPAGLYDPGVANGPAGGIGDPGLVGFRFQNEAAGNQTQYGWVRVRLPQTGAPGLIYDWAYEDTGAAIQAGAIPSPSALGLLAVGAAGLAGRRRKN